MKASLSTIQHVGGTGKNLLDIGVAELTKLSTNRLGGLEGVVEYGKRFDGVVVAKVVSCVSHDNSDHLHVCMVDDGGVAQDVERNKDGYVQVVCGAPNVREGLIVAWIPPGATVPSSLDEADAFVLSKRDIRGKVSNGMLASPSELGLFDNHDGILEISEAEVGAELIIPGTEFKKLYGLDDVLLDFENKMFTHRPDCFGQIGLARELAGIEGQQFTSPSWYSDVPVFRNDFDNAPSVGLRAGEKVPRLVAVNMKNIKVGESPVWLKSFLTRMGGKPVNNVVDVTNYVMHITGQPTHAYDLTKLAALGEREKGESVDITARLANKGEKINLLNGKTAELDSEDIVISSGGVAVGVAGIMGGSDTEVDENTTDILLEVASFDMYTIRKTAMKHGLFTDAFTRFSKGQSPLQNDRVMAKLMELMTELCDAEQSSMVNDFTYGAVDALIKRQSIHDQITVSADFINSRLGTSLAAEEICQILNNVEISSKIQDQSTEICVTPPFWRTDLELKEDIVEEVGRLYGFDRLELKLPLRSTKPAPKNLLNDFKTSLRNQLAAAGANEVLSYSFVHGDLLRKTGVNDVDKWAFHIRNAISPDLQYYRTSLLPSLLVKVHPNLRSDMVRSDDNEFALFEIGKAHVKQHLDEEGLPSEFERLAFVFAADEKTASRKYQGAAYYQAKKYMSDLLQGQAEYRPLESNDYPISSPYQIGRSAMVYVDGELLGVVGELRSSVKKALKLPDYSAGFELDLGLLMSKLRPNSYQPIGTFPKTQQDITFRVDASRAYDEVRSLVWGELLAARSEHGYESSMGPRDIFQKDGEASKNLTFRIWLWHPEKTLKTEEVNRLLDGLATKAKETVGAERI